jgi:hypothetical protein
MALTRAHYGGWAGEPMWHVGCAFGQTGAAQLHLNNYGVGLVTRSFPLGFSPMKELASVDLLGGHAAGVDPLSP